MKLFHATAKAERIQREGFRDSEPIPSLGIHAGVWFADVPTTRATTQRAQVVLAVEIPDELASRFLIAGSPGEVVGGWREFCIPARLVNRYRAEVARPSLPVRAEAQ